MDEPRPDDEFPSLLRAIGAVIAWIGWPLSWPGRLWDGFWWMIDSLPNGVEFLQHQCKALWILICREAWWLARPWRKHGAWTFATVCGTLGLILMAILQLGHLLPSGTGAVAATERKQAGNANGLPRNAGSHPAPLDPRLRGPNVPAPLQVRPRVPLPTEDFPPPFPQQQYEPGSQQESPFDPPRRNAGPTGDPLDTLFPEVPLRTQPREPTPYYEPPLPERTPRVPDFSPPPTENIAGPPEQPRTDFPPFPPVEPLPAQPEITNTLPPRDVQPPAGEPGYDPLDALFPTGNNALPAQPRPQPPRVPIVEQRPEPRLPPWDIDVFSLPGNDDSGFVENSVNARPELPARLPRDNRWRIGGGVREQVRIPQPYRDRWTLAEWEQLRQQRREELLSSDLPAAAAPTATDVGVVIERSGPRNVVAGTVTSYQIRVRNTGRSEVAFVDVDQVVPKTHVVTDVNPPAVFETGTLQWRLENLRAGETRVLTVELIPEGNGEIETTASAKTGATVSSTTMVEAERPAVIPEFPVPPVSPREREPLPERRPLPEVRPDPSPVQRPEPSRKPEPIAEPVQLRLQVETPSRVHVGEKCPLEFRVTNVGRVAAERVRIRNTLPLGMSHRLGNDVEYLLGRLAPGESKIIRLVPTLRERGRLTNRAYLLATGLRTEPVLDTIFAYEPALRLRRWGWKEIPANTAVTFTNHVENTTTRDLTQVEVTEVVPSGFEVVQVGEAGIYDAGTRKIRWQLDRVRAGETQKLRVTVRSRNAGRYQSSIYGETATQSAVPIVAVVDTVAMPARRTHPQDTRDRSASNR